MTQLKCLQADESVPESVRQAAVRLATKVDLEHKLPFKEDPLEDVRGIITALAVMSS